MSIEEIIKKLDEYVVMLNGLRSHYPDTGTSGMADVLRSAIALLKTHPEAQPNEPMTQKDLLGMDGKWVWLTDHIGGKVIGWGRVSETSIQAVDGWLDVEDCGVEFDAYRRPPKEEDV